MENSTDKIKILMLVEYCQVLELSVKIYIGQAYELIHNKMGGDFVFNYSYNDVAERSLERVIDVFKKLNNNEILIKKLLKLKDHRNLLAHKALLLASESLNDGFKQRILGHTQNPINFDEMKSLLDECMQMLAEESFKLASFK